MLVNGVNLVEVTTFQNINLEPLAEACGKLGFLYTKGPARMRHQMLVLEVFPYFVNLFQLSTVTC